MRDPDHPKLAELERLLNDPEVPLQAARVWDLLAEISGPSMTSRAAPAEFADTAQLRRAGAADRSGGEIVDGKYHAFR